MKENIIIPDKLGPFIPKTFKPIFKWKVDQLIPVADLPTYIRIISLVNNYKFVIISHPYGYGNFTAEIRSLGFGGKYFWLHTKDAEKAIQLAENHFKDWVDIQFKILSKINNHFKSKEK